MRLRRNPVRNIRSRTAICRRGLIPPGDFPPGDFLVVVFLREGVVMIVVVGWVKERSLRIIIKVRRLKD